MAIILSPTAATPPAATTAPSGPAQKPQTFQHRLDQARKNPQETLMLSGIVVAITGVAVTFFAALSALYTVSFLFLTAVSACGYHWTRKCRLLEDMQRQVELLKRANLDFQQTNRDLQQTNNALRQTQLALQQTSQDLQQNNVQFTENNQQLSTQLVNMSTTNQELRANNTQLTGQITTLQTTITNLRAELLQLNNLREQLAQTNTDLTQNNERLAASNAALGGNINQLTTISASITAQLGQFHAATGALLNGARDVNGQIGQFRTELTASLATLDASLDVSRQLSARLQENLQAGRQDVAQGIQDLRTILNEWRADGSIPDKIRALTTCNQQIRAAQVELERIRGQFELHNAELGHVRTDLQQVRGEFQAERAHLGQVRLEIQEETHRLGQVRQQFQENTEAHHRRLGSQIHDLQGVVTQVVVAATPRHANQRPAFNPGGSPPGGPATP